MPRGDSDAFDTAFVGVEAPHPTDDSGTIAAVRALRLILQRFSPRNITLPEDSESARMLRALGAAEASPAAPPVDFLEKLRQRLVAVSRAGRVTELSRKDLRYAPWLLWNGDPPAATLPGLLSALFDQACASAPTLRRLIDAYLRDFDPGAPGINETAAHIRKALTGSDPRLEAWRVAQTEVRLFDPMHGPETLADRLLTEEHLDQALTQYKLADPLLATGRYMMAVENAALAATPPLLRRAGTKGLEQLLRIIAPAGELRFPARVANSGRALLRAWLDGGPEPATAVQEPVRRELLGWLGDPRLRPQRWAAVGEQETSLMRRWLARASLDLFFKLIDEHALEAHWRYRHSFWLACLGKGVIADAWLALGSQAYDSAGAVRELGRAYGRLRGPGVTGDQSALLLRVGSLVFAEFSHNGKLRAWPADWRNAPQLGRQEYERADLTGKCLPFPLNPYRGAGGAPDGKGLSHIRSHEGYWQGSAAALVERHTSTRITALDWRPR
jgi:hypothetical protein